MTPKPKDGGATYEPKLDEFTLMNLKHVETALVNQGLPPWASWIPRALAFVRADVEAALAARVEEGEK
jgi:hypothetical protein